MTERQILMIAAAMGMLWALAYDQSQRQVFGELHNLRFMNEVLGNRLTEQNKTLETMEQHLEKLEGKSWTKRILKIASRK